MKIADREIGPGNPVLIVAELSGSHLGSEAPSVTPAGDRLAMVEGGAVTRRWIFCPYCGKRLPHVFGDTCGTFSA